MQYDSYPIASVLVFIGKVRVDAAVEFLLVYFRHERLCQGYCLFAGQIWGIRPHRLQRSMYSPDRWRGDAEVNVRGAGLLPDLEIIIDVGKRMRIQWRN